jgi:hypothetical protein
MSRPSTAVAVWGASGLGISPVRVYLAYSTFEVDSSKPLLEGPLPHPNRMASCQGNFDSTSPWYVDWDQVSKLAAVPDNNCCGCSYNLLDWRQILCRMVLLLLWLLLLFVVVFVVVVVVVVVMVLYCCPLCRVFSCDVCHFCCPLCRALFPS